jgi:addiction module RelE/StbE family toxin
VNYRISRQADRDLRQIGDYIAADNPSAADRMDERIHQAIQQLAKFPELGHRHPNVDDERYRFWTVRPYVIAYRIERGELIVVRVIHGAREFRRLFR